MSWEKGSWERGFDRDCRYGWQTFVDENDHQPEFAHISVEVFNKLKELEPDEFMKPLGPTLYNATVITERNQQETIIFNDENTDLTSR